jgi:hypothetical protein
LTILSRDQKRADVPAAAVVGDGRNVPAPFA